MQELPALQPETEAWLDALRDLLHHYLPPLEPSPPVVVGALALVAVGLVLVFRGGRFERVLVCAFAFAVGGWIGQQLAAFFELPGPISVAIAGLLLTVVAYKTYRAWLAAGSVVFLFSIALMFELGQGDLTRYLPTLDQPDRPLIADKISALPSKDEQMKNLYHEWREQIAEMGRKLLDEMKQLGLAGWIVPLAAAVAGGLLAFWALRAFAVVWLGFIGAVLFVLGALGLVCAIRPNVRETLFAHPQYIAAAAIGLWLVGLILQAKAARFPRRPPQPAEKTTAKS